MTDGFLWHGLCDKKEDFRGISPAQPKTKRHPAICAIDLAFAETD